MEPPTGSNRPQEDVVTGKLTLALLKGFMSSSLMLVAGVVGVSLLLPDRVLDTVDGSGERLSSPALTALRTGCLLRAIFGELSSPVTREERVRERDDWTQMEGKARRRGTR